MKSILIEKPNQLSIIEREIPTPSAGENWWSYRFRFWSYPGGDFLHHDGILVSDRHYDHGIFCDWFNLCAENARSERP